MGGVVAGAAQETVLVTTLAGFVIVATTVVLVVVQYTVDFLVVVLFGTFSSEEQYAVTDAFALLPEHFLLTFEQRYDGG